MDAIGARRLGASPDDVLIVPSDHGFASGALGQLQLLARGQRLSGPGRRAARVSRSSSPGADSGRRWTGRTRAPIRWAGDLYVNVKGRESDGIVSPGAEYESVRGGCAEAARPEGSKTELQSGVFKREDIYRRFNPNLIPDHRLQPARLSRLLAVDAGSSHAGALRRQQGRMERGPLLARPRSGSRSAVCLAVVPCRAGPSHRRRDRVGSQAPRCTARRRRGGAGIVVRNCGEKRKLRVEN
jgi:hypothetical protein